MPASRVPVGEHRAHSAVWRPGRRLAPLRVNAVADEFGDGNSSFLLEAGDGMGIDVQGHGHGGLAEPFADNFGCTPACRPRVA